VNDVLKHKGYLGSVDISFEDNCLHGKLLYIRDTVTYEAPDPAKLEEAFREAVEDYLETCAELKREPQRPCSGTFNVRIGPELHRKAVIQARLEGMTLNDFMKDAVKERLEGQRNIQVTHVHRAEHIFQPVVSYRHERTLEYAEEESIWQTRPTTSRAPH